MYEGRFLTMADDAYSATDDGAHEAFIQKQMVNTFCDGLYHDHLK